MSHEGIPQKCTRTASPGPNFGASDLVTLDFALLSTELHRLLDRSGTREAALGLSAVSDQSIWTESLGGLDCSRLDQATEI